MVSHSESRLFDVEIVSVYPFEDSRRVEITSMAGRTEAYEPDDPAADENGWVLVGENQTFTATFGFAEPDYRQGALDLLCRWRDEHVPVFVFSSDSEKAVGYGRLLERGEWEGFSLRFGLAVPPLG